MKTLDTGGTKRHQGAKAKAQQATASSQRQNRKQQKPLGGTPRMAPMQNTTQEVKVRTRSPGGAPSMATKQNTKKPEYNGASHSWSNAAEKSEDESWNVKRRKLEHLESRFWQRW